MPTTPDAQVALPRAHHWWDPAWNRATWILFFVFMIPVIGGLVWISLAAGGQTRVEPATQRLAAQLAGGPVQPFQGTEHTVYQATAQLPSAAHPRPDGRLTLAWMSGTNCGTCGKMDAFAWSTLESYSSKFVVMEKDLGRQPLDARYGVTTAPAFALLSPAGAVLARFNWQPSADGLKAAIDRALAAANTGDSLH